MSSPEQRRHSPRVDPPGRKLNWGLAALCLSDCFVFATVFVLNGDPASFIIAMVCGSAASFAVTL